PSQGSGSSAAILNAPTTLKTTTRKDPPETTQSPLKDDSPLTTQLERDLAKSSGVTRWLFWLQALEKAAPSDFPRLARLAQDTPVARQFVAARWVEVAPRHFFDSLVAAAKEGRAYVQPLAHLLFTEWPKRDPEAAIAALNEPTDLGMRHTWQMDVA